MKDCGHFVIYHLLKSSKMLIQQLKGLLTERTLGPDAFTGKFYQIFKDQANLII